MAFNLEDYTTVQERSNIFWERYPNGAVRTKIISESDTRVIVVCELFRDSADEKPFATGHAKEVISESFPIGVSIEILRWKIARLRLEALLLKRLISVLKKMDQVEKKWLG